MYIIYCSGIIVLFLLIYYKKYSKEYNTEFYNKPNGDLIPKDRMLKESNGNRNVGIFLYFLLWFLLAALIANCFYLYTKEHYSKTDNILLLKGMYVFFLISVILPSLFFVSNLFENIRNKIPLEYTRVDYSPIVFSKNTDKFYLKAYPKFILIEVAIVIICSVFSYGIFNTYINSTSDGISINRFYSFREEYYNYSDITKIQVRIYENDESLSLSYDIYFDEEKIELDKYFNITDSFEKAYYVHNSLLASIEMSENTVVDFTRVDDEDFDEGLERLRDEYADFILKITQDYEEVLNDVS